MYDIYEETLGFDPISMMAIAQPLLNTATKFAEMQNQKAIEKQKTKQQLFSYLTPKMQPKAAPTSTPRPVVIQSPSPSQAQPTDNKMLLIGGAVAVGVLLFVMNKKK